MTFDYWLNARMQANKWPRDTLNPTEIANMRFAWESALATRPEVMETRRIWKFPLVIDDKQYVEMPADPEILSAQFQGDTLCVWAMVEPANAMRRIQFRLYGTGHPLPDDFGIFVATVQQPALPLVWHLFVVEPRAT